MLSLGWRQKERESAQGGQCQEGLKQFVLIDQAVSKAKQTVLVPWIASSVIGRDDGNTS